MSSTAVTFGDIPLSYRSATKKLAEPKWEETGEVLKRLLALRSSEEEDRPNDSNIAWAETVLLHVLPRGFLADAEVQAFAKEIQISWECDDKRIVALLPKPDQLKIYKERIENGRGVGEQLVDTNNPTDLCHELHWLYS